MTLFIFHELYIYSILFCLEDRKTKLLGTETCTACNVYRSRHSIEDCVC